VAADRPNVVLIVADDLGYADIGAQGRMKDVRTPNVDTIAKNGVRCTSGYVSCPVCSPTRAGLMTGRYQQRFGHEFNPGPNESADFGLPLDQVTLAQALKSAGYVTGMVGKWHLGFRPEMRPPRRGFDEFFGFLAGAHSYVQTGEGRNAILRGDQPVGEVEYLTDAFGKEAAAFVERHHAAGGKPFFLYLPFNAVHTPPQVTEKYEKRFADVTDPRRRMLLAKLSALDDAVGLVLEKIREHKLEKDTLIFFISDNGGPTASNGSRNDPLSGFKGEVKEGGVREPFLIQWTGHLPAGKVYDHPVISLDLFPTALAAAGARAPDGVQFDGVNLLPYLNGETADAPHKALYWRYGPQWAVRQGNLKLRHAADDDHSKLFDLAADPAESHDLSAKRPDDVGRLRTEYEQWNAKNQPPRWHSTRRNGHGQKRPRGGGGAGATTAGSDDE
jgi:arylsulfatase A-like enzyme